MRRFLIWVLYIVPIIFIIIPEVIDINVLKTPLTEVVIRIMISSIVFILIDIIIIITTPKYYGWIVDYKGSEVKITSKAYNSWRQYVFPVFSDLHPIEINSEEGVLNNEKTIHHFRIINGELFTAMDSNGKELIIEGVEEKRKRVTKEIVLRNTKLAHASRKARRDKKGGKR